MNPEQLLSTDARLVFLVSQGYDTRDKLSTKMNMPLTHVGKNVKAALIQNLVVETDSFVCPHCHKEVEGLGIGEYRLKLTKDGLASLKQIRAMLGLKEKGDDET